MLASGGMIERTELRSFTGLMAWVANLCPQVNPFTQMLWAAVSARADHKLVYLKQVIMPLEWILAFTKVLDAFGSFLQAAGLDGQHCDLRRLSDGRGSHHAASSPGEN